ncbi:MAG: helicase-related protein [Ktedonobacteraceae bacterium]
MMEIAAENFRPPSDFSLRIKTLRKRLGLSQQQFAELFAISSATLKLWEQGRLQPAQRDWQRIALAEVEGVQALLHNSYKKKALHEAGMGYDLAATLAPSLDFTANADVVRVVVEGERLTYGHLFNPAFATEISLIEPLPHQRMAVYEHMLKHNRLRFLLADDAGAGKTIMTGLYIREMLTRRLIARVLIVPPAGLVGNWEHELRHLFNLSFRIVSGGDARTSNPFTAPESDLLIVSIDTLRGDAMFARLQEADVLPYDLVIFDEAHKLAADREPDLRFRRTDRYRLAETLAGIPAEEPRWALSWSCHHLLLLTATPHMGKDYPYYCLWRLLEPDALASIDAFNGYPLEARRHHFIRRTKEELVYYDGKPIYPPRYSNTLSYDLQTGEVSEQYLYDETTSYISTYYNRAEVLNRSAARLAMSVFQRRLASSTYALLRSFERRQHKLARLIEAMHTGKLDSGKLKLTQATLDKRGDIFDEKTADEEEGTTGIEENELAEEQALEGVLATTVAELETELRRVAYLCELARQVYEKGSESKFERLREVLVDPAYKQEKMIIFTEHRDTLDSLVQRLNGLGFTDHVAQIHGGMNYKEREEQVRHFRTPMEQGGAQFLVATDAAGEGINLQVCWLMVNYDIPWNPARLEQRMGRIHRFGQKHSSVLIMNLVAGKTREGRVMKTLLEKLEKIRRELGTDKVFDVIGRLFEGVSLREYMEQALLGNEHTVERKLAGTLTKEQVEALQASQEMLYGEGDGGAVKRELPRLRESIAQESYRHLLPGFVRRFLEQAAPLVDIGFEGSLENFFTFRPLKASSLDWLLPRLELYTSQARAACTVYIPRTMAAEEAIFLHPGEPIFDRFRAYICDRFAEDALRGAIFVDPAAAQPYFFHLAQVTVIRQADLTLRPFQQGEVLEARLIGLKQWQDGRIELCAPEQLLLLRGVGELPAACISFAASADDALPAASTFARAQIVEQMAHERRQKLYEDIPERLQFVERSFSYQAADLAELRRKQKEKADAGDSRAKGEVTRVKQRQRELAARKEEARQVIEREPLLIVPGEITFLAHALVVPSSDPEDQLRYDADVEAVAVQEARAFEESLGATVVDVSTAERALNAGLGAWPGFDLLSLRPAGERVAIEVKGRADFGSVELTENEYIQACQQQDHYWLYAVFECAKPRPRLCRVQNPFRKLVAQEKKRFVIDDGAIFAAEEL